jgi:hypothetical protein
MKQTALEWFFDNLKNHEIQAEHYGLYKQAKEMEKEQIIDAYIQKRNKCNMSKAMQIISNAEQYYNKTYKSE